MPSTSIPYFDVVIIGAGLSGVGAAYHLQHGCPEKTFVALGRPDELACRSLNVGLTGFQQAHEANPVTLVAWLCFFSTSSRNSTVSVIFLA